jgi:hypothetical protein
VRSMPPTSRAIRVCASLLSSTSTRRRRNALPTAMARRSFRATRHYSVDTFFRLREAAGDTVGVNFDPSHLMWMGADPLAANRGARRLDLPCPRQGYPDRPAACRRNGRLETKPAAEWTGRAWNYVTHDEAWWRRFCAALAAIGYDDVLSIEYEDMALPPAKALPNR